MRVSKIIDVESFTKMDGIIGCDRPSRVDWGVCRSAGKWSRCMGLLERLLKKKKSAWVRWRQSARSSVQTVPFPRSLYGGMGTRLNVRAPMFNDQMIKRHHFCYGCQQSCSTAARNAGQVKRKAALATIPIRLVGGRIEPTLADLAQELAVFPSISLLALTGTSGLAWFNGRSWAKPTSHKTSG
jgi:hypothetical protein